MIITIPFAAINKIENFKKINENPNNSLRTLVDSSDGFMVRM